VSIIDHNMDVCHAAQCCCCGAHAPTIHAASHVEKRVRVRVRAAWFSISMHACGSAPIVLVLPLAALRTARAPLKKQIRFVWKKGAAWQA